MALILPFTGSTPFDPELQETLTRKRAGPEQRRRDVALWNIYADWLEDNNMPNGAAFVRKYVEPALEIVRRVNRRTTNGSAVRLPGRWKVMVVPGYHGEDAIYATILLLRRPHRRTSSLAIELCPSEGPWETLVEVAELCSYVERALRTERKGS